MSTIFSKIIKRELPATILFENERLIAIQDVNPLAPVHLLIITKKQIASLQELQAEDLPLINEIVSVAQEIAKRFKVEENYRLLTNIGLQAGQTIYHLHFHLIGGRPLGIMA